MKSDTCLDLLLSVVCNVFEAHTAVLFLPGDAPGTYRLAASFSLSDSIRDECVISPGEGLVGWILRNEKPFFINNFDQKRGVLGYYEGPMEASIRAFMGVPLDDGGGCLCLDTKSRYAYQQKDTKILHQFGQLVTRIEGMSRLGDETDERHRFYAGLEAIHSLHQRQPKWSSYIRQFLDLLSAACGFDYCFLAARGERGEDYFIEEFNFAPCSKARDRAFPMSAGLVGWVFKNHRRLVNVDRDPGPPSASLFGPDVQNVPVRSLVCLPLRVHRTTRGVLVVADEQPRDVGENLLRFLDMAAGHLALLLENLYLKNRLTTQSGK